MIEIENTVLPSEEQWRAIIRGMRNPMNSWDRSDSGVCKGGDDGIGCNRCAECLYKGCEHPYNGSYVLGVDDYTLMQKLALGGPVHAKYRRMIPVYADVTAPFYWWKEYDTYKVGTVANSCSTMHKVTAKEFVLDDFSHDHMNEAGELSMGYDWLMMTIEYLNNYRERYLSALNADEKQFWWWQIIQTLPTCYNQKRTIMVNYEVLTGIYASRNTHKLYEWRKFCSWIESLPYARTLICGKES